MRKRLCYTHTSATGDVSHDGLWQTAAAAAARTDSLHAALDVTRHLAGDGLLQRLARQLVVLVERQLQLLEALRAEDLVELRLVGAQSLGAGAVQLLQHTAPRHNAALSSCMWRSVHDEVRDVTHTHACVDSATN